MPRRYGGILAIGSPHTRALTTGCEGAEPVAYIAANTLAMNPIVKNILGVVAGLLVGNVVNGGIVALGPTLIPPPPNTVMPPSDADFMTMIEIMKGNLPLMTAKDWVIPFLAHALGTLAGALVAVKICATHKKTFAVIIGVFFLLGGITMGYLLDFPMPFSAIDLILAYIPMALLGHYLGR
jgi:hypothetical protein